MSFDLAALKEAVERQGRVGRLLVAAHQGSVPREAGTSMLVWSDGQSGTIGGGALEFEAVERLRSRLVDGKPEVQKLPLGPNLGQCCGGAVTLVSEVFTPETLAQIDPNAPLYVRQCGGDAPQPLAITRAIADTRKGQPLDRPVLEKGWLVEAMTSATTAVWIYGAGHVGRAIVAALGPLPDVKITWVDTGPERFPDTVPDGVTALPVPNPADAAAFAPANAHHLILTYSHALDLELCHRLLTHPAASIGLIGSKTKWARFRSRLKALGHPDSRIDQITCPIGEPALGKHPQAIALGVASALVMRLRAGAERAAMRGKATG